MDRFIKKNLQHELANYAPLALFEKKVKEKVDQAVLASFEKQLASRLATMSERQVEADRQIFTLNKTLSEQYMKSSETQLQLDGKAPLQDY
jgi:hypothetical protein